jgi:hypothetical protein
MNLKEQFNSLKSEYPEIFDTDWYWNRTRKIEMNFRSRMKSSEQIPLIEFPYTSVLHVFKICIYWIGRATENLGSTLLSLEELNAAIDSAILEKKKSCYDCRI